MRQLTAPVYEIFCSRQGEGLYCGKKQVFLRFAGCNLDCSYCDEPAARSRSAAALTPSAAAAEIIKLARSGRARSVSLTGGEPLLHWRFIKELAPSLKKAGLSLHLETNGTLYRRLPEIGEQLDAIAMDIKLPSSGGQRGAWSAHRKFLAAAPGKTFIKVVLTSAASMADFKRAADLAAAAARAMPFFIQPATKKAGSRPPSARFVAEAAAYARDRLSKVKILPQQHPLWKIK